MHDDYYNADDDDVIDEDYSENEMVIDNDVNNDFNDVQLSLQSNLVESDVAAPKARTISSMPPPPPPVIYPV